MRTLLVSIAVVATLVAPAANATEIPLRTRAQSIERRHQLRVDVGLASAVGFGGLSYGFSPSGLFQLEAGIGYGFSGLQLSLMPKLTAGSARHKFILGAGPSLGLGDRSLISPSDSGPIFFLNVDVGYQYVSESGFTFNIAGGPTVALNGRVRSGFFDGPVRDAAGMTTIQGRIGFGYCF